MKFWYDCFIVQREISSLREAFSCDIVTKYLAIPVMIRNYIENIFYMCLYSSSFSLYRKSLYKM